MKRTDDGGPRTVENRLFYRSYELTREGLNEEKREIDLSFSSETPIPRWFGDEILLHGEKNVDLTRLESTGSLLYGHNAYDIKNIIGPIKRCNLDKDKKKGRALVGFDDDEEGNRAMGKVKSGSLRGVSCGYNVDTAHMIYEGEEWTDPDSGRVFKGPAMVAVRWTPVEISLTPVPADTTVGVGRDLTRSLEGIDIIEHKQKNREVDRMEKDEIVKLVGDTVRELMDKVKLPTTDEIVAKVRQAMGDGSKPKLNISPEQLQDLTSRAAAVSNDLFVKVTNEALAGKTEPELLRMINDEMIKKPDAHDSAGTDKEDKTGSQARSYKGISDMPDDVFLRSIK